MSHRIQSDIDYVGAFLFEATTTDPADIATEDDLSGYADAPPPISGYRKADIAGLACWNCGHFVVKDDYDNDGDVDGVCELFEAKAEGEFTCDRFTAHADLLRQAPQTSWSEDMQDMVRQGADSMGSSVTSVDYADQTVLNEIGFSSEDVEESDGLIWKDILRTGRWTHTPVGGRLLNKALQIVRDGQSDPGNGIISLSELYQNFNEKAIPYVTIPLSDDTNDHKNIARVNTGFVRKLKLVDRDGMSVLVAGMDFTEPDVKEKVLRGTIPDVSAGVPYFVTRRSDNKTFNTVLDHVCLTRKPFVDSLTPFGMAAANGEEEMPVEDWEPEASKEGVGSDSDPVPPTSDEPTPPPSSENPPLSFRDQQTIIQKALGDQLRLSTDYQVDDLRGSTAIISNRVSHTTWEVPFRMTGNSEKPVVVASVENWKVQENKEEETSPKPEPIAASNKDDLQHARELRELRLAQPTSNQGGIHMSELLEGVELTDEARTQIQTIISENETLRRRSREGDADKRVEELEKMGMKERPGALKLYRQVFLSDDGGPACVLFSDSDDESKQEKLTAIEILDRFIEGLKADGGVVFSDQHFASGNDNKPPENADGESKPLEERVENAQKALYGKHNRRK